MTAGPHYVDRLLNGVDRFLLVARVVRRSEIVLDAAPDTANRLSRFFLAHDRGAHVSSQAPHPA